MPEENFEEKARRKAEEFSMEPNAEVWLRVKAAIVPERRRRVLLWWWLLPLCLAGTVGVLLLKRSGGVPEQAGVVSVTTQEKKRKTEEDTTVEKPANEKIAGTAGSTYEKVDKKEAEQVSGRNRNRSPEAQVNAGKRIDEREGQHPGNSSIVTQQESTGTASISHHPSDTTTDIAAKGNADSSFLPNKNIPNAGNESKQTPIVDDSLINPGEKLPAIAFAGKDSVSVKPGTGKAAEQKTKTAGKKWQIGIVAEAGLTSWGKDLLTKGAKTASQYAAIPSNSAAIDSLNANTSGSQQTKNGVDAGIGLLVRKDVTRHFYISGQLGYRYQQYEVYNVRTSSGAFQSLTIDYLVSRNHYHGHFINLCAGAGKVLLSHKNNTLSVEAGFDNSLLLMNKQAGKNQSALNPSRGTDSAGATFYKWQPQLFLSLPFDWRAAGKVKVAVSPFARVGLRTYQKNAGGYSGNHLMAAGIQAIYFFR